MPKDEFEGFLFLMVLLCIYFLWTNTARFRKSEKEYREYYEKRNKIFKSFATEKDFVRFKRNEILQFYFTLFILLFLILKIIL